MSHCVKIDPVKLNASPREIKAAIQPSAILSKEKSTSVEEKSALRSALGWKEPIGLFGYSKDSIYKDLWIYFDLRDKSSPVNEIANRTFYMYGLNGSQAEPSWCIRGTAFVIRIEPDYNFSPNAVYHPLITTQEMYDTIIFFRDAKDSPRKIAMKRDSVRLMNSFKLNPPTPNERLFGTSPNANPMDFTHYMGTGMRTSTQVKNDADVCDACGKSQAILGRKLKACQVCKVTFYCDRICQKKAWKKHKMICKTLGR